MRQDTVSRKTRVVWARTRISLLFLALALLFTQTAGNSLGATEVNLRTPTYPDVGAYFIHLDWSHTEDWLFNNYEVWINDTSWRMVKRITNPDVTEYNTTGLLPNTYYQFRIRDSDSLGHQDSNIVSLFTLAHSPVTLSQPLDGEITYSSVELGWSVSYTEHYYAYHIIERRANDNITVDTVKNKWVTDYTVTGLSQNTKYCFFVQVENKLTELSSPSNVVCLTTDERPEPDFWADPYHIILLIVLVLLSTLVMFLIVRARKKRT